MRTALLATTYYRGEHAWEGAEVGVTCITSWMREVTHGEGPAKAPPVVLIADDGSEPEVLAYLVKRLDKAMRRVKVEVLPRAAGSPGGVGASLNRGFRWAMAEGMTLLYAVDDWALTRRLDLEPLEFTMDRLRLSCLRLGPPHPGTTLKTVWAGGNLWLGIYDKTAGGYVASQRPALYDPERHLSRYGFWTEGVSALRCEWEMNEAVVAHPTEDYALVIDHPWFPNTDLPSKAGAEPEPPA